MKGGRGSRFALVVLLVGIGGTSAFAAEKNYPYGQGVVKWVSTEWLADHRKDSSLSIVDTQPNVHDYITEHIPGAVNLPWRGLMADDNPATMKPDGQIQQLLKQHNVSPDKTVIIYCGTGREATDEFLLLKWYLGYPNVRLYEGSFTEWTAYPDNPTVTGENPR